MISKLYKLLNFVSQALFLFIKILESKQKKIALTSFCYLGQEIWLGYSWKLICIDQSKFLSLLHPGELKNI